MVHASPYKLTVSGTSSGRHTLMINAWAETRLGYTAACDPKIPLFCGSSVLLNKVRLDVSRLECTEGRLSCRTS